MQKIFGFSLLIVVLIFMSSCTENRFDVKFDKKVEIKVYRFEQDLMNIDTSNVEQEVDKLYQKYPRFFPAYTYGVIGIGGRELKDFSTNLLSFVSNSITQEVYQEIQKQYKDVSDVKAEMEEALSYYNYYFPETEIPDLYFMQSGFNQKIIVDSLIIGVALDMCLGAESTYYQQLALPDYLKSKMTRNTIALDAMRGMAWSNFAFDGEDNLASNMIYEGKIQYLMDALFPKKTDAEKLLYTEDDLNWVNQHENDIWDAIIQDEMLYQTDHMKIKNMINNAPFTQAFGNNSPEKIGVWLGWKIVTSYMEEHPNVTLHDLMMNKDYIGILNESNYKP
jgi:hypothetical protein